MTPSSTTHIRAHTHYNNVIMGAIATQTTSLTIVYSTVYTGPDQRKHQSSASLAFVRAIHRGDRCEFPAQMASNAENVSIWWRYHDIHSNGLNPYHCCLIIPQLTHWGQVTHIWVGNLTINGSDNGLSPSRHQAIIWTNAVLKQGKKEQDSMKY